MVKLKLKDDKFNFKPRLGTLGTSTWGLVADMPHGTDCPYPIRILAFFEMIRLYRVGIRIPGKLRGGNCKACVEQNESFVIDTTTFPPAKFPDKYDRDRLFIGK